MFKNYGWFFWINSDGIRVMINGRYFAVYRGISSRQIYFDTWENIWRKERIGMKDCQFGVSR